MRLFYNSTKRYVAIDVWRGIAILIALLIHYTAKVPSSTLIAIGDFFSGYFSVGVVFGGIAGLMGWVHFGHKATFSLPKALMSQWKKAFSLLIVYSLYDIQARWLFQADGRFLSIFAPLASIYLLAPFLWFVVHRLGKRRVIIGWFLLFMGASIILTELTSLPTWVRSWFYDYWINTTPLIPMLMVYCGGAMVAFMAEANWLTPWLKRLALASVLGYSFGRYYLNANDIYPNNHFFIRLALFFAMATVTWTYRPKKWNKLFEAVAFIGSGSFWIFTVGNILITALPESMRLSATSPFLSTVFLLLILSVSIASLWVIRYVKK